MRAVVTLPVDRRPLLGQHVTLRGLLVGTLLEPGL